MYSQRTESLGFLDDAILQRLPSLLSICSVRLAMTVHTALGRPEYLAFGRNDPQKTVASSYWLVALEIRLAETLLAKGQVMRV